LEEAERGPGDAVAPEPRRGRRRGRRRGHERDDQRREPGAQPAGAGAAAAPAGRVRPGEASAGEASPAEPEHEAELRALESALRAGEPRSAADIGAFDEREQALLTDAWPGAPVREGQGPMRRRSQHGLSMEETFEARRERMADERRARKGTLYVVATPIGNLEDMTFRAVRILKEVKLIAAEDTRQTAKLLNHYQIRTPLTSFFEHNEQVKTDYLLRKLEEGQTIALVSDAGTPGISDPGYVLVKAAVERGVNIVPVPGPCAAVAALSASGLPTDAWVFVGFLPQKEKKRREVLESLKLDRRTLIFYEAPTRTLETIHEMCEVLGNRDMVMIREMTKMHEEVVRGKFSKVLAEYRGKEIKGEVVLAVAGWAGKIADREGLSLIDRIRLYKQESGLPLADVVRLVARETGTPKSEVYRESLKLVGLDPDKIRPLRAEPAGGPVPPSVDARAAEPASGPKERFVPAPEPGEGEPAPRAAEAEEPAVGPEEVGAPVALPEPDTRSRMAEDAQPVTAVGGAEGSVLAPEPAGLPAERPGQAPEPEAFRAERPGQAPEPAGLPAERLGQAPEPAPESSPAGAGNGAGDDVAGVEVVEGRPGSSPVVPLAPRQE
jgi:16S rRNA (cytidine1402-2'-O)-methyltransferase